MSQTSRNKELEELKRWVGLIEAELRALEPIEEEDMGVGYNWWPRWNNREFFREAKERINYLKEQYKTSATLLIEKGGRP